MMREQQQTDWTPKQFIDEEVIPTFLHPPMLSKKPSVPDGFHWQEETFQIVEMLATWFDYKRRGKMARNMSKHHQETASRRGSWGVGRWYFRVRTACGRVFDLYYDRAPKDSSDRKGHWYLWRELDRGGPSPS